ncbi:MAG TPA: M13 family metallopeptidase [Steroidobacteraceae bacterium]|jgi:predicted metalloendopeptidase|nr:M13 family metallopeptidase [Steroidobacteraceae bacterium]
MKLRKSKAFALAAAALAAAAASAPMADPAPISGIQNADMDRTVRPQDDLFQFANGTWLRDVPIPADRSSYGVDSLMTERSLTQQRELIEAAQVSSDPEARKVSDLYSSYMNEARIERLGRKPLQGELQLVESIAHPNDIGALMAQLDRIGIATPMAGYVRPDSGHSTRYAFWLTQSGLGLPDRDYYLSDDARLAGFRGKYREHVENMLHLLGDAGPAKSADRIVALETAIAKLQWTRVANRDSHKTYNPQTPAQLAQLAPAIDWKAYFAAAGLSGGLPALIVRQPDYLQGLSGLIQSMPLTTWKSYFRYRVLSSRAPFLPRVFVQEDFAFNQGVLQGTEQAPDRWKRGTQLVDRLMGEASGKLYVARYFSPATKARIDELVRNLLKAYAASIDQLPWMSAATKVEAQAKLRKIDVKIGYPDHWRDYGKLLIVPDDLLGNVRRARQFERNRKLEQLDRPVDRSEWNMSAPTVNAYYNPSVNEIVFPAGQLQPPAFNPAADDAFNYGSAGATIGHEISHGFDDQGSQYDSDGNLRDWWTAEDHAKFKAKTALLIKEYDAFEPVPGFHVNGALTLGENIADIAGIEIAYKAYHASLEGRAPPVIDGMSADQRFFIGFAQSWLGKRRDESSIAQVKSDPHSPEKFRTNGVVVHLPGFYSAFSVLPGDKMFMPPGQRVVLW